MDRARGIDCEDSGIVRVRREAAEPVHFQRIEFGHGIALHGELRQGAFEDRNDRTIVFTGVVETIGDDHSVGAGKILRHDIRMAGNIAGQKPRDETCGKIIDTAR